jgi:hypothetical protein
MGPTSGGDAALMCLSSIRSRFVRRSRLDAWQRRFCSAASPVTHPKLDFAG